MDETEQISKLPFISKIDKAIDSFMVDGHEEQKQYQAMNKYNGAKCMQEYRKKLVKKRDLQNKIFRKNTEDPKDLSVIGNDSRKNCSKQRAQGRPGWKKINSTKAVTAINSTSRHRKVIGRRAHGSKPPTSENMKSSNNHEFKRPNASVNHESEITRQREFRKKLDMQLLEIDIKSKARENQLERYRAGINAEREVITKRLDESADESFSSQNDRSRRKKWGKNSNAYDINTTNDDSSSFNRHL